MDPLSWIEHSVAALHEQHLHRAIRTLPRPGGRVMVADREVLNFSSNDYLDLARHPCVLARARAALDAYGAGATASRLVAGSLPPHDELEARMARFKGYPAALLYGSGYLANTGIVPCLVGRDDHVFVDRLAHASLYDAAALSRATLHRFHHNDAGHLDEMLARGPAGKKLVLTESVFSMDGDLAPLPALAETAARHGAMLLVDEAHATGVQGPGGRGLISQYGLQPSVHVSLCTLSKALGSYGGVAACPAPLRDWLVNKSRSLIYSTALPPGVAGAALGALDALEEEPDLGRQLRARCRAFRELLRARGITVPMDDSPIVPIQIGDNQRTLEAAARLRERGIYAIAIRPPTVPPGTARLRLSVTLAHREEDLARAAQAIAESLITHG